MTAERPTFGASEVIEIASKLEAEDEAFVIGGQATNFWAWLYRDKEADLRLKGPFTSEDIDYFGTAEVARAVAAALGGTILLPNHADDHTASTALIETTINDKPLRIDFLGAVLGVQNKPLVRNVSTVEIPGDIGGKPATVRVKVMHPLHCVKSRIANMLSPLLNRRDRIAQTQAEASLVILRRHISDRLDEDDKKAGWREAHLCFREMYQYLRSDGYGKKADLELGVDPLAVLKHFENDSRIDQRYRNRTLKPMITKIEARRNNRR